MKLSKFTITFLVFLAVQVIFSNYFQFTPFITLSILPLMIVMIPVTTHPVKDLLAAFFAALCVDFFSDGVLGLNAFALVPVALLRRPFISLIFGSEIFARKEGISIRKHGILKMSVLLLMAQTVFLVLYIWADGAGTRPVWFNLTRFAASLLTGLVCSLPLSNSFVKEERDRWS